MVGYKNYKQNEKYVFYYLTLEYNTDSLGVNKKIESQMSYFKKFYDTVFIHDNGDGSFYREKSL